MGHALYDCITQASSFCVAINLSLPYFSDDLSYHFVLGLQKRP